ncbi:MAG: MqnA/MqnD/SBP family protein, partial [Bacteroidota bacterium]|nr:MqnA/MqnD/SBP family protein [Bacteroidota bacterium]
LLKQSIEYAFENTGAAYEFIKENAQEMSDEVIRKHINLYVNSYSINLGEKGREAIKVLFEKAQSLKIIPDMNKQIFLT